MPISIPPLVHPIFLITHAIIYWYMLSTTSQGLLLLLLSSASHHAVVVARVVWQLVSRVAVNLVRF